MYRNSIVFTRLIVASTWLFEVIAISPFPPSPLSLSPNATQDKPRPPPFPPSPPPDPSPPPEPPYSTPPGPNIGLILGLTLGFGLVTLLIFIGMAIYCVVFRRASTTFNGQVAKSQGQMFGPQLYPPPQNTTFNRLYQPTVSMYYKGQLNQMMRNQAQNNMIWARGYVPHSQQPFNPVKMQIIPGEQTYDASQTNRPSQHYNDSQQFSTTHQSYNQPLTPQNYGQPVIPQSYGQPLNLHTRTPQPDSWQNKSPYSKDQTQNNQEYYRQEYNQVQNSHNQVQQQGQFMPARIEQQQAQNRLSQPQGFHSQQFQQPRGQYPQQPAPSLDQYNQPYQQAVTNSTVDARQIAAQKAEERQRNFEKSAVGKAAYSAVRSVKTPEESWRKFQASENAKDWLT